MTEGLQPTAERLTPNDIFSRMMDAFDENRFPGIPTPELVYTFFRAAHSYTSDRRYQWYASTAISSGGIALPRLDGAPVPFKEAIGKNSDFALKLMGAVIADNPDVLSPEDYINPVTVGKIPIYHYELYGTQKVTDRYYGQDDYLRLWYPIIVGVEAVDDSNNQQEHWQKTLEIMTMLNAAHADLTRDAVAIMNDTSLSHEERAEAYREFTETYIACINYLVRAGAITVEPVEYLVGLIDNKRSLGGRYEDMLAKLFGSQTLRLALTGSDWQHTEVSNEAEELLAHGAEFAVPENKIVLALAPRLRSLKEREEYQLDQISEEHVATKADKTKQQLRTNLAAALIKTMSPRPDADHPLLASMTDIAYEITADKRHLFHPYVIAEVLRLEQGRAQVSAIDIILNRHAHDNVTQRALETVMSLRNPDFFAR